MSQHVDPCALNNKIGSLSSLGTSEKGSVVGAVNELVGNRIKKRTFSMTASEVKSITDLPSRYMLFANGASTSQLGIWVGTGYGSTTSRHILKEITGNSALNISVTVGSSVYGLNITNSSSGSTNFTLVEMA